MVEKYTLCSVVDGGGVLSNVFVHAHRRTRGLYLCMFLSVCLRHTCFLLSINSSAGHVIVKALLLVVVVVVVVVDCSLLSFQPIFVFFLLHLHVYSFVPFVFLGEEGLGFGCEGEGKSQWEEHTSRTELRASSSPLPS